MVVMSLSTGPVREPITLAEVKAFLRLDEADTYTTTAITQEDTLLSALIKASRQYVENLCGPLINQTWVQYQDSWPDTEVLELWKPRVSSVTSITYLDSAATSTTFSSSYYEVDTADDFRSRIILKPDYSWPTSDLYSKNPITITFVAGYGTSTSDIPEPVRLAMLYLVNHWYEERNIVITDYRGPDLQGVPMTVEALLANYRFWLHT